MSNTNRVMGLPLLGLTWMAWQPAPRSPSLAALRLITHGHLLLPSSCLLPLISTLPGALPWPSLMHPSGSNSMVTSPGKPPGPPAWVLSAPALPAQRPSDDGLCTMGPSQCAEPWARPGVGAQGTRLLGQTHVDPLTCASPTGHPPASRVGSWVPWAC